ncbi:hypothetical protein [Streptomyces sp. NPDC052107]|uniref:hypothetical protein n=1 Tax=Streptomyces sp. NPDC052107 TaxID=3155632 RepID=UPI00344A49C8
MAPPYEHVNYDFGAAAELSQALAQAVKKLHAFAGLRVKQRSHLLGESPGPNWRGAKRNVYDTAFGPQKDALDRMSDNLARLVSAVANATDDAHAVNARTH